MYWKTGFTSFLWFVFLCFSRHFLPFSNSLFSLAFTYKKIKSRLEFLFFFFVVALWRKREVKNFYLYFFTFALFFRRTPIQNQFFQSSFRLWVIVFTRFFVITIDPFLRSFFFYLIFSQYTLQQQSPFDFNVAIFFLFISDFSGFIAQKTQWKLLNIDRF